MGLYKADLALYLDTDAEDNPRLQNAAPTTDSGLQFQLGDFSHNNVSFSHVTVLQISSCVISEIPIAVQKLNLKQLVITRTNLEEIPSCLYSGLRSLELLDLSHNLIRNFHIEPACSLVLVKLKLCHNQMEDFPHWVLTTRCPKLREVYYSGNYLKKKLETARELCFNKLEMCNTQLRDVDFVFLKKIKSLECLDIGNDRSGRNENRFKDINGLFVRFKWKHLHTLKLNNLVLSIVPEGLFSVTSLIELHLVNCDLNWIPENIRHLKNLKVLDISENGVCSLPTYLTTLKKLSIVKACFNNISSVGEFHNDLEILDLYKNQLENFSPSIERIKYLDLEKNILDTSHLACYEIYKAKRDDFRESFDLQRTIGPIELPEEIESESEHNLSLEEQGEESSQQYYDDVEEECWDDEEPINVNRQRNPEITPSDDEWNGREEVRIRIRPKPVSYFDVNEDWIFCDADEDC